MTTQTKNGTTDTPPRFAPPHGYLERNQAGTPSEEDIAWDAISDLTTPTPREMALLRAATVADDKAQAARRQLDRARTERGAAPLTPSQTFIPTPTPEHLAAFSNGTLSATDFLALDIPDLKWLVEDMIPAGALGVLLAAEKTGKSLLALDCGGAIATGTDFYGRATTQTNVLIIEQEGSKESLQRRIRKMFDPTPLSNLILRHREEMDLTDPDHLAGLQAFIHAHNIGLAFIGPLAQTGNVEDENSATAFNQIAKNLNAIINATGTTIILVHHRRKPAQNDSYSAVGSFFNTSRGSSALMAAVDVAIGLQRAQEEAHGKIFVMLRDAPSSVGFYRFSFENLRITATDEAPANKTEQRASAVVSYMLDNPGPVTRYTLETELGIPKTPVGRIIQEAVERGTMISTGKGNRVTYELSPEYRARMERDPRPERGLGSSNGKQE